MHLMRFSRFFIVVVIGFVSCAPPASADACDRTSLPSDIDAVLRLEPDFFDLGHEQFELEIEHLLNNQLDEPNTPILIIDESVMFDADTLEPVEEQPVSPDIESPSTAQ